MTVGADPRCMTDGAFLPDPDNALEAHIAVRKAVETIDTRFGGIPHTLPHPTLPHVSFAVELLHDILD